MKRFLLLLLSLLPFALFAQWSHSDNVYTYTSDDITITITESYSSETGSNVHMYINKPTKNLRVVFTSAEFDLGVETRKITSTKYEILDWADTILSELKDNDIYFECKEFKYKIPKIDVL